ncbi:MAG TPA: zinc ribbon domain-containing protein [Chloroflexi bacterium]|nr:zinc ribbon domain-containing protein [Chloroflexota bacterium]
MIETILESIPFYLTILSTVCGGITAALVGGMAIWTFRDIRSRSRDVLAHILATLLVLALPIVGLIVYLMLRPHETLADAYERSLEQEALLQAIEEPEICPGCGQRVRGDYLYCPACHTRLKRACPACHHPLNLSWSLCPYCGTSVTPQVLEPVPASSPSSPTTAEEPAGEPGLESTA